jgi:hypothetical protein
MKIGIIGLPGSGKTTVFNLLAGEHAQLKTHPSGKGLQLNLGTISIPDPRLEHLTEVFQPKKTTPTQIVFVDVVGPAGTSLKDLDITPLRDSDAFALVVGVFKKGDFLQETRNVETEFILMDLELATQRLKKLAQDIAKGKKEKQAEYELIEKIKNHLETETLLRHFSFSEEEKKYVRGYEFLTVKPMVLVANLAEDQIHQPPTELLRKWAADNAVEMVEFCAEIELEISKLEKSEQDVFLKDLGITNPARDSFIRTAYDTLGLISFFTVVGTEVRVWTVRQGTPAVKAAGKVHSDMERGFIRAEVIAYDDFVTCDSTFATAKAKGLLRLEGKDYVVRDGDIINFRFNV